MEDPIVVDCPKCGTQLKCPASAAGKTGKCSGCGSPVTIPDAHDASAPTPTAVPAVAAQPKIKLPVLIGGGVALVVAVGVVGYLLGSAGSGSDTSKATPPAEPASPSAETESAIPKRTAGPPRSAAEAVRVLEKLAARTEVGVNHIDYTRALADMLVATRTFTNSAAAGEYPLLAEQIRNAADRFMSANRAWERKIERQNKLMESADELALKNEWLLAATHVANAQALLRNGGTAYSERYRAAKKKRDASIAALTASQDKMAKVLRDTKTGLDEIARPHLRRLVTRKTTHRAVTDHAKRYPDELNERDDRGQTPLHRAIYLLGRWEAAIALIEAGADVNAKDEKGLTPLLLTATAVSRPRTSGLYTASRTLTKLLEAGADVNAADGDGNTPLHRIVKERFTYESVTAVNELLEGGARASSKNKKGETPVELLRFWRFMQKDAMSKRYSKTVEDALVKAGG